MLQAQADSRDAGLQERIRQALQIVIDPEIGRSVVDLGLIYAIDAGEGTAVRIEMTTTTRGCPAAEYLVYAVRDCVQNMGFTQDVDVRLTYEPPWSPDMMID